MTLELVGGLLLPADGEGEIRTASERWRADLDGAEELEAVIWGREPTWLPAGWSLVRHASDRERSLLRLRTRPPGALSVGAVHRWTHPFYASRFLPRGVSWMRQGAVVELSRDHTRPRVLDAAARAAGGGDRVGALRIGSGGTITAPLALARRALLRAAPAGSPVDPSRAAEALARLAPHGLRVVPEPLGRGHAEGASWTAESFLTGRAPARVTRGLVAAVAAFCLDLPRGDAPPSALRSDVALLAARLPTHAARLHALEKRVADVVATLPSVLCHGDLWTENLLVDERRLSGVVDWDAWHEAGTPGTDLLHLVASAHARAHQLSFAETLAERPWANPVFTGGAAGYWRALDVTPSAEVLEAVGVAWWAGQTAGNLGRTPAAAAEREWLRRNVEPVLGA